MKQYKIVLTIPEMVELHNQCMKVDRNRYMQFIYENLKKCAREEYESEQCYDYIPDFTEIFSFTLTEYLKDRSKAIFHNLMQNEDVAVYLIQNNLSALTLYCIHSTYFKDALILDFLNLSDNYTERIDTQLVTTEYFNECLRNY